MSRKIIIIILSAMLCLSVGAQQRKVQNRPYTDLRPFHFGIHVGAHFQEMELLNAGYTTTTNSEGQTQTTLISTDQDRADFGFNVGVAGEFRLSENFQFRVAPGIYFGSRHLVFQNITASTDDELVEQRQDLKSAYITTSLDLIFAAPRCNNHRAYMLAGLVPTLNLTGKSTDNIRLKNYQTFVEVGFGFDEYLPFFKCRPELKFMFGLGNALYSGHPEELRDENIVPYAKSAASAQTKMLTLSFYFE